MAPGQTGPAPPSAGRHVVLWLGERSEAVVAAAAAAEGVKRLAAVL
jgi:hypothetical protein